MHVMWPRLAVDPQVRYVFRMARKLKGVESNPSYGCWREMRRRCNDPNRRDWPLYGGRGITVCERWSDFRAFAADMGERPSLKHSLDRIDSNGHYTPSNCRWATPSEQRLNQRHRINCVAEAACVYGVKFRTVRARVARGWPVDVALRTPLGRGLGRRGHGVL